MKNKHCKSILLFIFILLGKFGFSQYNDAELWLSVNIEKKINKSFAVKFAEELRFNENISQLGTFYSEIGIEYKVLKFLSVGGYFRYINKLELDRTYNYRLRYYFDLTLKHKFKPISISLRSRFQSQYKEIKRSDEGNTPENYLREKLQVKFIKFKKFTPYISGELFFQLNNPSGNEMDNMRYALGLEYNITKHHQIDGYYLIDKQINVVNPCTAYIVGLSYTYSF